MVNVKNVSAALTLNGGVAVGTYGAAASHGLGITSTGSLDSQGGPMNLNWIVRYNTVQEQSAGPWASSTVESSVKTLSGTPTVTASFTGWSVPAAASGWGDHFNNRNGGTATFTHCQFSGGRFTIDPGSVDLINCLWQRVSVTLRDLDGDPEWNLYNNLFHGGTLYYRARGDDPTLRAYDNCFDRTTITRGGSSESFTHDYNGYITGQDRLTPSPGPHDVVLANMVYAPGPLGGFYQGQTDLLNQGSRSAADAGLDYGYTVVPDQTRDGADGNGDPVDIGFHYRVSDPPTAYCQDVVTGKGQDVTFTLTGFDPYGGQLSFAVVPFTGPSYGTLPQFDSATGSATYRPNANFEGVDSFNFTASAWGQTSSEQPATIYVTPGPVLSADCRPFSILLTWDVTAIEQLFGGGFVNGGFKVYRATTPGGPYTLLIPAPLNSDTRNYTDASVTPNIPYYYVVTFLHQVFNCDGNQITYESPDSNKVGPITTCCPPTDGPFWTGSGPTAQELAEWLSKPGDTVANANFTGAASARGIFGAGGSVGLPFNTGIILSSGTIHNAAGPNDDTGADKDTPYGLPGDSGLDALLDVIEPETAPEPLDTLDAAVLEFDLTPSTGLLEFVFASEEYPEWLSDLKNDAVAIFVDGQNIAWVPGASNDVPVCVFTVNATRNADYFRENPGEPNEILDLQYDGLTSTPLHPQLAATKTVQVGVPVHVKIVIADEDDDAYDSSVFIKANRPVCQ